MLTIDLKTYIFQCSKNDFTPTSADTCNHVKSCTKHGRPDKPQRELTSSLFFLTCPPNRVVITPCLDFRYKASDSYDFGTGEYECP